MLRQFTERAKEALSGARGEAGRLGSDHVQTEHILLSLCRNPESTAARTLAGLGMETDVDMDAVAAEIERHVPSGTPTTEVDDIPFTARAKKVLELAIEEAHRFNHDFIGTEHLLLGLLKEGEGIAAKVLRDMKIELDQMQVEIARLTEDDGR